jgi:hypothetical protein
VVVNRWNSEHDKNGEGHKGLDWFRPLESKTLHLVSGLNGALGRHIWPAGYGLHSRSMDPRWGRLKIRKVVFCDYWEILAICGPTSAAEPRPNEESCTISLADPPESG